MRDGTMSRPRLPSLAPRSCVLLLCVASVCLVCLRVCLSVCLSVSGLVGLSQPLGPRRTRPSTRSTASSRAPDVGAGLVRMHGGGTKLLACRVVMLPLASASAASEGIHLISAGFFLFCCCCLC
ncbi:hypothetical protein F5B18DRAFT_81520 [Nemania serpens]|nr:hypothetical protein F5B18DRAFT_81520 [Nemania serpens]